MSPHEDLIKQLAEHPTDARLQAAFGQLARGADLHLVLALVKGLVHVGVPGLAARLLAAAGPLLTEQPELAALLTQLQGLPPGTVPEADYLRAAARNATALLEGRPYLSGHARAIANPPCDIAIYQTREGNVQVLRETPGGGIHFELPFGDARGHAHSVELPEVNHTASLLFIGVPSPALLERALAMRSELGYEPPIDIVEPDPRTLALWLGLADTPEFTSALAGPRLAVFTGDDWRQTYRQYLLDNPWRSPPTVVIANLRPGFQTPEIGAEFFEPIHAEINERRRLLTVRQNDHYAAADESHWAQRFMAARDRGEPLRIAGFTTRFSAVIQHSMRDLASAFERRGCSFELIKEANNSAGVVDTWTTLAEKPFDLVFVINHLRMEMKDCVHRGVPFVGWVQDQMANLWTRQAGQSVTDMDLVLAHAPGMLAQQYDYPLDRMLPTNNLTSPDTYRDDPIAPDELEPYRCDVAYVGHGSQTPEDLARAIASPTQPALARMLLRFVELVRERLADQSTLSMYEQLELCKQAERETKHPSIPASLFASVVYPTAARLYDRVIRHQTLQWAVRWAEHTGGSLRIYGRGWDQHPSFSPFAQGEVANGEPLRRVYQASTITLHMSAYRTLHQRVLDGLASGGFLLTRFNTIDFVREPYLHVARAITELGLTDLAELLDAIEDDAPLAQTVRRLEELGQAVIAPADDPRRAHQTKLLKHAMNWPDDALDDAGLLHNLKTLWFLPHREAADLPGFDQTLFGSAETMHAAIERFRNDAEARANIAAPMREAVLADDTYDSLIERLIDHFADRFETAAAGDITKGAPACAV